MLGNLTMRSAANLSQCATLRTPTNNTISDRLARGHEVLDRLKRTVDTSRRLLRKGHILVDKLHGGLHDVNLQVSNASQADAVLWPTMQDHVQSLKQPTAQPFRGRNGNEECPC